MPPLSPVCQPSVYEAFDALSEATTKAEAVLAEKTRNAQAARFRIIEKLIAFVILQPVRSGSAPSRWPRARTVRPSSPPRVCIAPKARALLIRRRQIGHPPRSAETS